MSLTAFNKLRRLQVEEMKPENIKKEEKKEEKSIEKETDKKRK